MDGSRKVVKNSLYGIAAEGVGGVLQFVTIIFIARFLGAEDFGVFSYVLAFVGVFQLIADFGLTNMIVREIVRDRSRTNTIIATLRPLIMILAVVVFLLITASINLFSSDPLVLNSTYVMAAAVLITFHAMVYASVCRAYEEMGYNAIGFVSHKIVLLSLVTAAMLAGYGIFGIAVAYFLANLYMLVFYYVVTHMRYLQRGWLIDLPYWKYLIVQAFPIGLSMVVRRLTLHVDTLVLTAMASSAAVGVFNSAYRVVQMADMIPLTLAIPLYPMFTRLAKVSTERLFYGFAVALRIFFLMAVPICLWLYVAAPQLILLMFGDDYMEAVPTLKVLSVAVLFLFPTSLYIFLFASLDKQKLHLISAIICLLLNIVLDIILIPKWGQLGAASATVIAEIGFFISGALFLRAMGCKISYFTILYKPFIAATVCSLLYVQLFADGGIRDLFIGTALYFVTYVVMALLMRAISKTDVAILMESINMKKRQISAG